jgi:hypothetical protein
MKMYICLSARASNWVGIRQATFVTILTIVTMVTLGELWRTHQNVQHVYIS